MPKEMTDEEFHQWEVELWQANAEVNSTLQWKHRPGKPLLSFKELWLWHKMEYEACKEMEAEMDARFNEQIKKYLKL